MQKLSKRDAIGVALGVAIGAAGGASTGPTEAEISQKVRAGIKPTAALSQPAHRPSGACLSCHLSDGALRD